MESLLYYLASVDKYEKNIVIVISLLIHVMKDQVSRPSLLGVSAISLSDISSAVEIKKRWRVENSLSFTDHLNLGLATLDGKECWLAKPTNPM